MNRRSVIASLFAMVLAPLGLRVPKPVSLSTHWTSPDMKLEPDGFVIHYSSTFLTHYPPVTVEGLRVMEVDDG